MRAAIGGVLRERIIDGAGETMSSVVTRERCGPRLAFLSAMYSSLFLLASCNAPPRTDTLPAHADTDARAAQAAAVPARADAGATDGGATPRPAQAAAAPGRAEAVAAAAVADAAAPAARTPPPAAPETAPPTASSPQASSARASAPEAPRGAAAEPAPARVRVRPPAPPRLQVTDVDPIHDSSNPAYGQLQKPSEALTGMPLDRMGRVNWVQALDEGLVAPRASVSGGGSMEVLERDIVMTDTRSMPHVLFPHAAHTQWLSCDNCHPEPFVARDGANPINMDAIFKGQFCGVCHDKVAFSTFVCERCHSIPHAGSPAKWW